MVKKLARGGWRISRGQPPNVWMFFDKGLFGDQDSSGGGGEVGGSDSSCRGYGQCRYGGQFYGR